VAGKNVRNNALSPGVSIKKMAACAAIFLLHSRQSLLKGAGLFLAMTLVFGAAALAAMFFAKGQRG
jgi:hypothetical protein